MRFADLEAVKAAAANQVIGAANGKMHRTALLLGDLGDQGEPVVGSSVRVGEGDAQGALVDVSVVEMLDQRRAEIVNPTESERRIVNSTMLVTEGEENSPEKLHEFATTHKISQKV